MSKAKIIFNLKTQLAFWGCLLLAGLMSATVWAATASTSVTVSASIAAVSTCGNGVLETGETCDNGASNGACPATCSTSCTRNTSCGPGCTGPNCPCIGPNCPCVGPNCPCVGPNCPCVGPDCPCVGADCPCVGPNCPCVGPNCPCVGPNCPCVGPDCPCVGANCPCVGLNCQCVGPNCPCTGPNCQTIWDKGTGGGYNTQGVYPVFNFYISNSSWPLTVTAGRLSILAGYVLRVETPSAKLPKPTASITVNFNHRDYFPAPDLNGDIYSTLITMPLAVGIQPLEIMTVYIDGTTARQFWQVYVRPWGKVVGRLPEAESALPLPSAQVTLYQDGARIIGDDITNPQITDSQGEFGFMVPNGLYTLSAAKGNWQKLTKQVYVADNVIGNTLELSAESPAVTAIKQAITALKPAANFTAPAITVIAVVNAAFAIPWWSFFYYLQYLFTEVFAWLFRRKPKGWGTVYNSITKQPIDLAVVRLYDWQTKKLLRSRVTDQQGRYNLLVEEGEYYLETGKSKFSFPSRLLAGFTQDNVFTDIYHGEKIVISQGHEGIIMANIPLDQEELKASDQQILRQYFWSRIKDNISLTSPILASVSFIVAPSWFLFYLVLLHLILLFLFRRLVKRFKAKFWGVVRDARSQKPLSRAVARIFAPEYQRMLEAQVTDRYGRYGFLAGNNIYYLTAEKDGYQPHKTAELDLRDKKSNEVVGQDIALARQTADDLALADADANKVSAPTTEASTPPETLTTTADRITSSPFVRPVEKSPLEETAEQLKQQAQEQLAGGEGAEAVKVEPVAPQKETETKDQENIFG